MYETCGEIVTSKPSISLIKKRNLFAYINLMKSPRALNNSYLQSTTVNCYEFILLVSITYLCSEKTSADFFGLLISYPLHSRYEWLLIGNITFT